MPRTVQECSLSGRTIEGVRPMRAAELRRMAWAGESAAVIVLDDGSTIICMRDDEGNGPGSIVHETAGGQQYIILAR